MNAERWAYIKALKPVDRLFHFIGKTYDVGKNKAKLAERVRSHPAGKYSMRAKRNGEK